MDKHGFQALAMFFLVWKNDEKIWEDMSFYNLDKLNDLFIS